MAMTSTSGSSSATGTIDTTEAPQIIEHLNQSLNCTPYDALWIPASPRFIILGMKPRGTGVIQLFELGEGKADMKQEVRMFVCDLQAL